MKPRRYDPERDAAIWRAYAKGARQVDVGRDFGISHQRVSQIVARYREGFVRCWACGQPHPEKRRPRRHTARSRTT